MWPLSIVTTIATLLFNPSIAPQRPQLTAERALLDSLLTELTHASGIAALPKARCNGQPAETLRLCDGLIAERRSEFTGNRDDALAAELILERTVAERPKFAVGWYGLGRVREQLSHDSVYARGGALMQQGTVYANGAINAYIEAIRLDPNFSLAADAIATTTHARGGNAAINDRVNALRRVRDILSPFAMMEAANLERAAGHIDSAVALEERALASGRADSGLVSLGLARDYHALGRAAEGRAVLIRGAATKSVISKAAYRAELAWMATPAELAAWDTVSAESRSGWIRNFWQKRDIEQGRKDGARLIEHYRRIEYALKAFAITIPLSGRQKMHSYTQGNEFYDENEAERLAMRYGGCFTDFANLLGDGRTIGHDSPFDYYKPFQDQIDDRGVVYVRQGEPTKIASNTRGDAVEIWVYNRPDSQLVLQFRGTDFQGSTGAGTLVPSILSMSPGIRNQVCAVAPSLCSPQGDRVSGIRAAAAVVYHPAACPRTSFTGREAGIAAIADLRNSEVKAEGSHIGLGALIRARDEGRAAIDRATTTDSYFRDFAKSLHPLVEVYGLDQATGGAPRAVVAFALPGNELGHTTTEATGTRAIYPVSVQIIAARTSDGMRIDSDTLRQFSTTAPLTSGQFITGTAELPLTPGRYSISVIFTQTDGHGAIGHLSEIVVPGAASRLSVTDLVLGRANSGVHWNSGTTNVAFNPLNTYPKGGSAEIYFQLSGLVAGTSYKTSYEFYRVDDDVKKGPKLTVASSQVASDVRMEISRSLGLAQLDPGRYRVKLTVSGSGAETSSVGWLTIVK